MSSSAVSRNKKPMAFLLLAGLLVGTLDIVAACVDYYIASGKGPENVLKYIASAAFGREAFLGSEKMMGWGLLFHYIIAIGFTFFFYWLYVRLKWLGEHPFLSGIIYGIFMWVIMTRIVIPLSKAPGMPFHFWKAMKSVGILIVMIGWPLAYLFRSYFRERPPVHDVSNRVKSN